MERNRIIDWNNIQKYREEYHELVKQGLNNREIMKHWGISGNASFYQLKRAILNQNGATAPAKIDKDVKKQKKKIKISPVAEYQAIQILEEPIFCLVVGFRSREAAFKALGQI